MKIFCNPVLTGVASALFCLSSITHAQSLILLSERPTVGTFYSLQLTSLPPTPYNPVADLDLDIYSWGNVFLVDDREVDYVSLREEQKAERMTSFSEGPPTPGEDEAGEGDEPMESPPSYNYSETNLWLEIRGVTNSSAHFWIHAHETNAAYDLFSTTNLTATVPGLNLTNWVWLLRTTNNQTDVILTNLAVGRLVSTWNVTGRRERRFDRRLRDFGEPYQSRQ